MAETVVILGAGATKACKGPLTNEILPEVFLNKADFPNAASLTQLEQFLQQNFHVATGAPPQDYPGLPLLMSLIDTAIERRQAFHLAWDVDAVTQLRHAMELAIFDLLEYRLEKAPTNNHYQMLSQIYPVPREPRIISMNYDVIIDAAVMFYAPYVGCQVWRARVYVVGLGHGFNKFGLRVSFGDASSSFFARWFCFSSGSYSNPKWSRILDRIRRKIDKNNRTLAGDPVWQGDKSFYENAHAFLAAVRVPIRNSTMHVETLYDEAGAENVFGAVKTFMRHIAIKLKE